MAPLDIPGHSSYFHALASLTRPSTQPCGRRVNLACRNARVAEIGANSLSGVLRACVTITDPSRLDHAASTQQHPALAAQAGPNHGNATSVVGGRAWHGRPGRRGPLAVQLGALRTCVACQSRRPRATCALQHERQPLDVAAPPNTRPTAESPSERVQVLEPVVEGAATGGRGRGPFVGDDAGGAHHESHLVGRRARAVRSIVVKQECTRTGPSRQRHRRRDYDLSAGLDQREQGGGGAFTAVPSGPKSATSATAIIALIVAQSAPIAFGCSGRAVHCGKLRATMGASLGANHTWLPSRAASARICSDFC